MQLKINLPVKVKVMLRLAVSRPVCPGSKAHLGHKTRFLLQSDSCRFVHPGSLSHKRTGLSFTIAADPHQRTHIYRSQNQKYMSSIFTILHVSILQLVVKNPVPCVPLISTVLHLTLVYMYVEYIQDLALQIMPQLMLLML
jgi:hypothetical protein